MAIMPTAAFICPGDAPKKAKLSEGTFERSENPKGAPAGARNATFSDETICAGLVCAANLKIAAPTGGRGNRPYQKGEYRWAKKRRACDKARKVPHHFIFSYLISHHFITVQQLLIRLAYNLTVSYFNEHSRASAGGALTDYFSRQSTTIVRYARMKAMKDVLLDVRDLKVSFPVRKGLFARTLGYVHALSGVTFDLRRGETLGIVGESGCGKTTLARAILRLNRPSSGSVTLYGEDVLSLRGSRLVRYRQRVQAVFQDPQASLNPRHTVRDILTEAMVYHKIIAPSQRAGVATELLARVGLDASALDRYPHEFSGGQRQRICIARAISLKPEILICDEAVSALDLSLRAQVLDLLADLKTQLGLSVIFITHDVGVVQHVADRLLVMQGGKIVERGECRDVLSRPQMPYTRHLLASVQKIGRPLEEMGYR